MPSTSNNNIDQAQFFFFLRSLVFGVGSPSSSAHRKMILLLDENSSLYRTPIDFIKRTHTLPLLKDFVDAQRGRLSLMLWSVFDNEARPNGQVEDDDDDEALMKKIPKILGPSQSVWFVMPITFCTPKLLRCVALYLLCGRMHPNSRFFIVCSRADLNSKFDDISLVPTITRHSCTTIAKAPRSGRTTKIFAVADLRKLGVFPVADRWSRDLNRTSKQTRDEWGAGTISIDSITTAGVALIEDVLTSAKTVETVTFHEKYGNGSSFTQNIASSLRFNYTTRTVDLTGSACNDEPIPEFAPSLRASRKLQTLVLKRCYLSDLGFADLGSAVRECSSLTSLDVSENAIVTTDGLLALAMALAIETVDEDFKKLDLQGNEELSPARRLLTGESKSSLLGGGGAAARNNNTVDANNNNAFSASAYYTSNSKTDFSDVGAPVCRLKTLSIRACNSVTSTRTMWSHKGLRQFFRYLGRISSLEELDVSDNSFTEEDAINFAEFCVPPPKTYDMNDEDEAVDASDLYHHYQNQNGAAAALESHHGVGSGDYDHHHGGQNGSSSVNSFSAAAANNNIKNNPSTSSSQVKSAKDLLSGFLPSYKFSGLKLNILNFSGNSVGDAGAAIIMTRLAPTLSKVDFSHCALSARAFLYCGLCVSRYPSFREFFLSYNDLSWEHALRVTNDSRKNSSKNKNPVLEKFLNGDGGLRESLENIPSTVSLSAIDISSASGGDGGAKGSGTNRNNNTTTETIKSLMEVVKVLTPEEKEELEEKKRRKEAIAARNLKNLNQGFGTESQDESQFCWFVDKFLQFFNSVSTLASSTDPKLARRRSSLFSSKMFNNRNNVDHFTLVLDVSHCVLASASVRTLLEGGILRGLIRFESLYLSGNYGVRGETVSLLAGEVAGHPEHSQYLRDLGLDDVDSDVRERALIGVFLASSSAFESVAGVEERSAVTGQIIKKKEKERHRANMETLFLRGPDLTDGMLFAIRACPTDKLPPLRVLDLSRMSISAGGAETITSVCVRCHLLEQLVVSGIWNQYFSPELQKVICMDEARDCGMAILKHFADLIMDSKSLKVLDLSDNGIGRTGVRTLVGAIKNQQQEKRIIMKRLVLSKNEPLQFQRDWQSSEIKKVFEVDGEFDEDLWEIVVK